MAINALLLTIFVGVFFLLGIIITRFIKNKNSFIGLVTGVTFIILLYLCFIDLMPEIIEVFAIEETLKYLPLIIIFVLLGFLILKILDLFIPEHTHHHQEENDNLQEHQNHLFHIGIVTSLSLLLHNVLEGISIYITGLSDFRLGLLMAITVGFHNLPLGMEIAIGFSGNKDKKYFKLILYFLLITSSFWGAFVLYLLNKELSFLIEGIFLSITLGMIFYLLFKEILPEILEHKKEKMTKIGILLGLFLTVLIHFI